DADRLFRVGDVAAVQVRDSGQARRIAGLATRPGRVAAGGRPAQAAGVAVEVVAVVLAVALDSAVLADLQALLAPAQVRVDVAGGARLRRTRPGRSVADGDGESGGQGRKCDDFRNLHP